MELKVSDLYKSFGEKKVLEGVGFHAESGSALGLLGRNGAGKTTTIRIIMGVFPPDSGRVTVDNMPIDNQKLPIGYLPEEHGLYPKQNISDQLTYLAQLRGMKARDARLSIARWLKRLGMQEYSDKKLVTLSKGNQQKIQLAAALITNPDLIILDEPFSGLDPVNASLLKEVVKELIRDGKIVLFSSHQMNYVEEFCDSIAILHEGKIVISGRIRDIKRSYDRSILTIRSLQNDAVHAFIKERLSALVRETRGRQEDLLVTLKSPYEKNNLIGALLEQNFDLDGIGVYEPTLSDIFVQYTDDSIQTGEQA
jgi:ABC-2 type transport system ATP-binding protein